MNILEFTFNLIQEQEEAAAQQQAVAQKAKQQSTKPVKKDDPDPEDGNDDVFSDREGDSSNGQVKVPAKIKKFVEKMVEDFGPEGSRSMDMQFMRQARDTLGIRGKDVSDIVSQIKDGIGADEIIMAIKDNTDEF